MNNFLHSRREGVALVTVLAFVAILTIILVAFVSQTRVEVSATSSYAASTVADALAEDALNLIILSLKREMDEGSTVANDTNGILTLRPDMSMSWLPQIDESVPSDGSIPVLLRSSRSGSQYLGSSVNSLASNVATDAPALGGRHIKNDRWNLPKFLTDAQNTAVGAPHWIYINRAGPVALTSWTKTLAEPFTATGDLNTDFVIGRFAYRIYDISGLLDVNVAGIPATGSVAVSRVGRKGGASWMDSGDLEGLDEIVSWRGPSNNYEQYVDETAVKLGFLLTPPDFSGINRFLGRGDLLDFAKQNGISDDALTQFTTFSREVNAPSWVPDQPPLQSPEAMNPFIPAVRVQSAFTRRNGLMAEAGESLVNTRFPLSKIDLLQNPTGNAAKIESWFGLQPNGDGTWHYSAGTVNDGAGFTDGLGARERLKTLEEISAENREPNFFELLQAGITADSLGQGALSSNHASNNSWSDRNIARHVLQIGLNIIDQYDPDDDPTVIRRTPLENLTASQLDPDLSGVENVPYIQTVGYSVFRRLDSSSGTGVDGYPIFPDVRGYYQFQLWNPHRNAGSAPAGTYRIVGAGNPSYELEMRTGGVLESSPRSLDPSNDWLEFTTSALKFAEPWLLGYADVTTSNSDDRYLGTSTYGLANIAGFWMGDLSAPYTRLKVGSPANLTSSEELYGNNSSSSQVYFYHGSGGSTNFQLQKLDGAGNWLPIQSVSFSNVSRYKFGETWYPASGGNPSAASQSIIFHKSTPTLRYHYAFADPRTDRFGMQFFSRGDLVVNQSFPENESYNFSGWLGPDAGIPVSATDNTYGASIGKLYSNTLPTFFYTERGSGVRRMGDPAVANVSSPLSPYLAGSQSRPVVLNRTFKNVAEMGHAFRDVPWRSVNFSSDNSTASVLPADSALLDLFAVAESPAIRAGTINLNSASQLVIKALLQGTSLNHTASPDAQLTDAEAESAATAIYAYLGEGKRTKAVNDPVLTTPGDVARMVQSLSASGEEFSGWSKAKKDTILMALAQVHGARTWNLFIDIVVQSGKFPSGSSGTLERFSVSGETRFFVHLAIDRITGEVVDRSVESAMEK